MYGANPHDVFYYLTLYNENYSMPERPDGLTDEQIVGGLYRFKAAPEIANDGRAPLRATLLAGGSIMQQALRAQQLLAERGVAAEVWSALSYQLLRNDALESDRWNRLHPEATPRVPRVTQLLREPAEQGPIVAVSDFITEWPDLVARWVPGGWYRALGTDGFGRSDTREALRRFFEIDAESIAATTLAELARCGRIDPSDAKRQIEEMGLDPETPFSLYS
jgi:pyruvate dehydrogenase E1 component